MLRLGDAAGSRTYSLITALDAKEITLREFLEAVQSLTGEEAQLIATLLFDSQEWHGDPRKKLARDSCLRWASLARAYC